MLRRSGSERDELARHYCDNDSTRCELLSQRRLDTRASSRRSSLSQKAALGAGTAARVCWNKDVKGKGKGVEGLKVARL